MPFSESILWKAWQQAFGRCECRRAEHGHTGRCNKLLSWKNRGRGNWGKWEAYHRISDGPDTASNCDILCWDCLTRILQSQDALSAPAHGARAAR